MPVLPQSARRPLVAALVVLAVVGAAACGSSESSATDPTSSSAPSSSTTDAPAATSTTEPSGTVVTLTISGGTVDGGATRHDVDLGEQVTFRVTSDVAEELHVHGYDRKVDLVAGVPAELTFTADIPGVFEVELEQSGLKVAELKVA